MKGIVLAGGFGTRLHPLTISISKQLLPVYDKPMIYYPLSVLMLAGIKEIMIISTPFDLPFYKKLLGTGEKLGVQFSYAKQTYPRGLAESFIIGEEFIGNESVCLILGDNILYGQGLKEKIQKAAKIKKGAIIFGYYVKDPERYGVVEYDKHNNVLSMEEKPKIPKSNIAIIGMYFYDNDVVKIAKKLKPSKRGELEITAVNQVYLKKKSLKLETLGRGIAWLDSGTHSSLIEAGNFVEVIEKRQGLKIACLEEIAYRMGFIDIDQLEKNGKKQDSSSYGKYILSIVKNIKNRERND